MEERSHLKRLQVSFLSLRGFICQQLLCESLSSQLQKLVTPSEDPSSVMVASLYSYIPLQQLNSGGKKAGYLYLKNYTDFLPE